MVLLVGLGVNNLFGWSWAGPVAGLVIAGVAVREGLGAADSCWSPAAGPPPDLNRRSMVSPKPCLQDALDPPLGRDSIHSAAVALSVV